MRIILLICFVFIANFANSQNITFDQAQNLRKKSLVYVEAFLTARGWSMTKAEEETDDKMGSATFGYKVDMFDSEKASGWISFLISSTGNSSNRISIQIHKPSLYTSFIARLKPNGYKLISTNIEDGRIKKKYANSTTTCVVTTSTSEGTYTRGPTYKFFFIDNFSYALNYEND
jgi:hypothetical protein